MSLHPEPLTPVPQETVRVARAAFPKGHPYLALRDAFGPLFADPQFAPFFPKRGQPAAAPWRLACITLLQFAEGLSDRQAADAVRSRLDWKYLLGLELSDPGFDFSVLCEFRARFLAHPPHGVREPSAASSAASSATSSATSSALPAADPAAFLLERLLARFQEAGLCRPRGRQRTDSTHVLTAVRTLNRLELVGETLRHTLDILVVVAPEWLRHHLPPLHTELYLRPFAEWRLPEGKGEREKLAHQIGEDGYALLAALDAPEAPAYLREVPVVVTLRQVWFQQYYREETRPPAGTARSAMNQAPGSVPSEGTSEGTSEGSGLSRPRLRWREAGVRPPASRTIYTPFDPEARSARKRRTIWVGYKLHVTETCEPDQPLLLTDVVTTPATTADQDALPTIHAHLEQRNLLPSEQYVDSGYGAGALLQESQKQYGVRLVGPLEGDTSWQARGKTGFAAADFTVDWEERRVHCPGGKQSSGWHEKEGKSGPVIQAHFSARACGACPHRTACTRGAGGRRLTLLPETIHRAVQARRAEQQQASFAVAYAVRAGVEGTHSQGDRRCRWRRGRYVGLPTVHLQHALSAAALNLVRVGDWVMGRRRAHTRTTPFARWVAAAA